jgi:hypothetical protein
MGAGGLASVAPNDNWVERGFYSGPFKNTRLLAEQIRPQPQDYLGIGALIFLKACIFRDKQS